MLYMPLTGQEKRQIFGVSLPKNVVEKIDEQRGDVPRSKFILRIIERHLGVKNKIS